MNLNKKRLLRILLPVIGVLLLAMLLIPKPQEVTIYYTNDVHSYIDHAIQEEPGISYSLAATLKQETENALLVDAGDHLQGTAYGGMDNGETIIRLMNAAGYDAATPGNHEFDYGMAGAMAAVEAAEFPYLSCNFRHEENGVSGDTVLDAYELYRIGGQTIAFVGITTPETITSSAPSYFQDEEGAFLYGIDGGDDGSELYAAVQNAIDRAEKDGADHIIALGHLGVDPSSAPWTSRDVIEHTEGLSAFIDGHSHTAMEAETVTDAEGNEVLLTQTGSYLDAIGKLTVSKDGNITSNLLTMEDLSHLTPDEEVQKIEEAWITEIGEQLGQVIGYAEVTFDNFDEDGNRLVRRQSTNTGDFSADALYYLFDEMGMEVDVAVMNGGGIRNNAVTGELSYLSCKEIHTFGNVACLLSMTGQQLLDALEWGSKGISADPLTENGSLLHVSGLRYTLDLSKESTVQADENDIWTGPPTDGYRVLNVEVYNKETKRYQPLDLSATYRVAGYNYTLRDLGGGFQMLTDAENILDYVAEDYMVLANYIESFPIDEETGLPTITAEDGYGETTGSGRITIIGAS